jgi:CubicO group peptidase (beta-lactamase class C family)
MEIRDIDWTRDRAGNPHGMAGLQIHPVDLAKIGQLVLDGGVWRGRRLVPAEFLAAATGAPGQRFEPTCGLLWWLSYPREWQAVPAGWSRLAQKRGLDPAIAAKLRRLDGRRFGPGDLWSALAHAAPAERERAALVDRLEELGVHPPPTVEGPVIAASAQGYGGQYLYVVPGSRLIAVRMSIVSSEPDRSQSFRELESRLLGLRRR